MASHRETFMLSNVKTAVKEQPRRSSRHKIDDAPTYASASPSTSATLPQNHVQPTLSALVTHRPPDSASQCVAEAAPSSSVGSTVPNPSEDHKKGWWHKIKKSLLEDLAKMSKIPWLLVFVVGIVSVPAGYKAFRIGLWTSGKDYLEWCRQQLPELTGEDKAICEASLARGLSPPPYFNVPKTAAEVDALVTKVYHLQQESDALAYERTTGALLFYLTAFNTIPLLVASLWYLGQRVESLPTRWSTRTYVLAGGIAALSMLLHWSLSGLADLRRWERLLQFYQSCNSDSHSGHCSVFFDAGHRGRHGSIEAERLPTDAKAAAPEPGRSVTLIEGWEIVTLLLVGYFLLLALLVAAMLHAGLPSYRRARRRAHHQA